MSARMPVELHDIVERTIESLKGLMPPAVTPVPDEIKDAIVEAIHSLDKDLRVLNLAIHGKCSNRNSELRAPDNPELAFKEV